MLHHIVMLFLVNGGVVFVVAVVGGCGVVFVWLVLALSLLPILQNLFVLLLLLVQVQEWRCDV